MLQTENFIYFFTVCGFFIGLMFSVLNFSSPWEILLYCGAITFFFYLFIHVVAINFVDFSKLGRMMFDKKEYEEISDYFIKELDYRENKLDSMLLDIEKMNKRHERGISTNNIQKARVEHQNAA